MSPFDEFEPAGDDVVIDVADHDGEFGYETENLDVVGYPSFDDAEIDALFAALKTPDAEAEFGSLGRLLGEARAALFEVSDIDISPELAEFVSVEDCDSDLAVFDGTELAREIDRVDVDEMLRLFSDADDDGVVACEPSTSRGQRVLAGAALALAVVGGLVGAQHLHPATSETVASVLGGSTIEDGSAGESASGAESAVNDDETAVSASTSTWFGADRGELYGGVVSPGGAKAQRSAQNDAVAVTGKDLDGTKLDRTEGTDGTVGNSTVGNNTVGTVGNSTDGNNTDGTDGDNTVGNKTVRGGTVAGRPGAGDATFSSSDARNTTAPTRPDFAESARSSTPPAASGLSDMEETGSIRRDAGSAGAAANEPQTNKPTTTTSSDTAPVTTAPKDTAPETTAPVTTAPETTAPETTAPVTTAPVTTAPETTAPVTTAPVTTAPETPAPVTTAPETTMPLTAVPDTPVPETTAPAESVAPGYEGPAALDPAPETEGMAPVQTPGDPIIGIDNPVESPTDETLGTAAAYPPADLADSMGAQTTAPATAGDSVPNTDPVIGETVVVTEPEVSVGTPPVDGIVVVEPNNP